MKNKLIKTLLAIFQITIAIIISAAVLGIISICIFRYQFPTEELASRELESCEINKSLFVKIKIPTLDLSPGKRVRILLGNHVVELPFSSLLKSYEHDAFQLAAIRDESSLSRDLELTSVPSVLRADMIKGSMRIFSKNGELEHSTFYYCCKDKTISTILKIEDGLGREIYSGWSNYEIDNEYLSKINTQSGS